MVEVKGNRLIAEISARYDELTKAIADVQNGAVSVLESKIEEKKNNLFCDLETLNKIGAVSDECVKEFARHLNHSVSYFRSWNSDKLKRTIFA